MGKSRSFKDKLREAFTGNKSPGKVWRRLGLIIVCLVAAQAVFRLVLGIMALLGIAFWVSDQPETSSPEQAAEARLMAEETSRIVAGLGRRPKRPKGRSIFANKRKSSSRPCIV